MRRNTKYIRCLRSAKSMAPASMQYRAFTQFKGSGTVCSLRTVATLSSSWHSIFPPPPSSYQSFQQRQQLIRQMLPQTRHQLQQRQWFGTRRRTPAMRGKNNKKAAPEPQFFEIDEDLDDGEQWKKVFGEEGDEWEEVPFDDDDGTFEIGSDDEDDEEDDGEDHDAATKEAVRKFLSSRRAAASAHGRPKGKLAAAAATSKEEEAVPKPQPHRQHSLNPRLSAVISTGLVSLNTTAKLIMGKTLSAPLLKGDEHYVKGRPSNAQLSLAYQMHQLIQDYLRELVDKRYDATFCIPGTFNSIEIRAVETSPDLHLARVYWSLPSDCLDILPDSLQVKLIHHMQDVVFDQQQGKRKIQRVVHTHLGYLRNPPKITMVWWDDEVDEFDYEYKDEETKDDEADANDDEVQPDEDDAEKKSRTTDSNKIKESTQHG